MLERQLEQSLRANGAIEMTVELRFWEVAELV
jgi:hypothetical protein